MCMCLSSFETWWPHSIVQSVAAPQMHVFAAGGHDPTTHQQHNVSEQSFMPLSMYAAKHDAGGSASQAAQSVDQTDACLSAPLASKAASASFEALHSDTSVTEAPSPSKYPDTKLYQFADIELAHGH